MMETAPELVTSATDTPLPEEEFQRCDRIRSTTSLASSVAASGTSDLHRTIIVRGTCTKTVSLPYNVARERERQENLIANRGPASTAPSTPETE
jgi:hypothetical protein